MTVRTKVVAGPDGSQEVVELTAEENATVQAQEEKWIAEAPARALEQVIVQRLDAYQTESDKLFFEEQAGEVATGTWAAKRAEIKARFPK